MIVHIDVVSEDRRFWKDGVGGSDTIVEPFRQVDNGHLLLYVPLDGLLKGIIYTQWTHVGKLIFRYTLA